MRVGVRRSIPLPGPFYLSLGHRRRRRHQPFNPAAFLLAVVVVLIVLAVTHL